MQQSIGTKAAIGTHGTTENRDERRDKDKQPSETELK